MIFRIKKWFSGSIAVTWFISYTVVFLIPLCIFLIFSMKYVSLLNDEIGYVNSLSIRQVKQYLDSMVQDISLMSDSLYESREIKNLLRASASNPPSVLDLYAAQERIQKTHTTNRDIEEFFIYSPSVKKIVSKSTYANPSRFFDIYLSDTQLSYESWESLLSEKQSSIRIYSFSVTINGKNVKKILFSRPLSYLGNKDNSVKLIVIVDASVFTPLDIRNIHDIIILDTYNKQIAYASNCNISFSLPSFCYEIGNFTKRIKNGDNDFIVSGIDSDILNWKYLAFEERAVYFHHAATMQKVTVVTWCIACFLGFGFVIFIIKYNYKPVRQVVNSIQNDFSVGNFEKKGNEFGYIHSAIERMKADKSSLMQNSLLSGLLQEIDNRKIPSKQELAKQGIIFQSNLFAIMVYRIDKDIDSVKTRIKIKTVLKKAFVPQSIQVFFFDTDDYIVGILNIEGSKSSEELYDLMHICIETICRLEMKSDVPAACSNIVSTYYDLNTAFVQAIDTLNFSSTDNKKLYFYKDMMTLVSGKLFDYPAEVEIEIIDTLKNGNEAGVMKCIDSVIEKNKYNVISPKSMRFLFLNIAGTVIKVLSRLDERVLAIYPDISLRPLFEDTDYQIFRDDISKIVHGICDVLHHDAAQIKDREEFSLYNAILTYINKEFTNVNLSVNLIADELSLSAVSLSRLFKKYNGSCISDYISLVRITNAKQLLKSGMGLSEVSEKSGFGSLRTFMRVFKNMEHMTPGQFEIMVGGK